MQSGIYDQLITEALDRAIAALDPGIFAVEIESLDPVDATDRLARHLASVVARGLPWIEDSRHDERRDAVNTMIRTLATALVQKASKHDDGAREIEAESLPSRELRLLKSIHRRDEPRRPHPDTPLASGALFTGAPSDPTLESQLRKEIHSADTIDLIISFVKWSGVRILLDDLRTFTEREGSRLRVLTTSYMGATEYRAVEELAQLPQTEVRVSYDTQRTRLHAKAYLFHRRGTAGTAYVGSSNVSKVALTTGSEWNVKVSQIEQPLVWEQLAATFESTWNDGEYQPFDPHSEEDRRRLQTELASANASSFTRDAMPQFDLRPYPFQQEILERLAAERVISKRTRHLVVAATGTGKTMIAAFDYRSVSRTWDGGTRRPRLLYVAHRLEILTQALMSFRHVLRDMNFGEIEAGGYTTSSSEHLFITIQSWKSRGYDKRARDHFEYVVIDEFHHAAAPSYRALLEHITPRSLIGLTATPERTDGIDVLGHFGHHISAEVRLTDAINRRLLAPFQYFGITDPISLADLKWQRGGYVVNELEQRYITGGDMRARLIAEKFMRLVRDPHRARAIAFCVSVAHAEYMAARFRTFGIESVAVTGTSDDALRSAIPGMLRRREVNIVCTVDLYNEGVDIPEIDTVLFLRPTESLTVFLQQLGRGLRLHDDKDCLTVLDFVGDAHRQFRFDRRFAAMTGVPTARVKAEIESGFPLLPAGCSIDLERVARESVLRNIDSSIRSMSRAWFVSEARELWEELRREPLYEEYIERIGLEPSELYRRGLSWRRIASDASIARVDVDRDEERLVKGLHRIAHIDAPDRIQRTLRMLETGRTLDELDERTAAMLHFDLWGRDGGGTPISTVSASLKRLRSNPAMAAELKDLLAYRLDQIDVLPVPLTLAFPAPLELHASYTRDEILAALGVWTLEKQREVREGVLYVEPIRTDVLFVTLDKSDRDFSPSTMYNDYAIGEDRFHWQSQSTTSVTSKTGQRYLTQREHGGTVLLFVRERKRTATGQSLPYSFLGPVHYERHTGSRPIDIIWRLDYPMPAKLLRRTMKLAAI